MNYLRNANLETESTESLRIPYNFTFRLTDNYYVASKAAYE